MELCVTRQQIGLLIVFAGTVALSFSVKTKRTYDGDLRKSVDGMKKENPDLVEPTETVVVPLLFRIGLLSIGVGTLLQW